MSIKLTNETFIQKAIEAHGDKYSYELVDYQGAHTKVKIICKEHGSFEQTPSIHLSGSGCKVCSNEALATTAKSEFETKASIVHNSKYSYELVDYKNNATKIQIICKSHGIYEQTPTSHLSGSGCPICANEGKAKTLAATAKSEFAAKSAILHDSKYDYSLVAYKNAKTKVKIVCKEHGIWEQTPTSHLSGNGCPVCALAEKGWTRTKFKERCIKNNESKGILYILECYNDNERFIKIGITSRSVKRRYNSKESMPYEYKVLHEITGDPEFIFDLETLLHKKSRNYRYTPSLQFAGHATECFKSDTTYLGKLNTYLDFNKLIN